MHPEISDLTINYIFISDHMLELENVDTLSASTGDSYTLSEEELNILMNDIDDKIPIYENIMNAAICENDEFMKVYKELAFLVYALIIVDINLGNVYNPVLPIFRRDKRIRGWIDKAVQIQHKINPSHHRIYANYHSLNKCAKKKISHLQFSLAICMLFIFIIMFTHG